MSNQLQQIRAAIGAVVALDAEWRVSDAGRDNVATYLPWMPFPWPDFIALVSEALPEVTGDKFLDIGCGPGAKMLLADVVFGLNVRGVERVPEYVKAARERGLVVDEADALGWKGYGDFDLVFFNRPFYDQVREVELENQVFAGLKPGAVLITANLITVPPSSWYPILNDSEVKRWIVQKL
jgi:trans-aconitate methyltransferase